MIKMDAIFVHNFLTHTTSAHGFVELLGIDEEPKSFDDLFNLVHKDDLWRYLEEQGFYLEGITKSLKHSVRFKRGHGIVLLDIDYKAEYENTIVTSVRIRHTELKQSLLCNYDI